MDAYADKGNGARERKLSDQLYEQIFAGIVDGEFAPQARLPSEIEMSERFGVSRPVVREALARLRDDGLVVSRQGSGSYVKRRPDRAVLRFAPIHSIADMQRCFEFRSAFEGRAAALAAERRDDAKLAAIERALQALDEVIRAQRLGVDADVAFHLAVAEAGCNRYFVDTIQLLRAHIGFGMNLARNLSIRRPAERLRLVQDEHAGIYEAIRDRDAAAAERAMTRHINNARQRVFEGG